MVDISSKPPILRIASASGSIYLQEATIRQIQQGTIRKGDPLTIAQVAAISAVKRTPHLIPLCHQIPITSVETNFTVHPDHIQATVTVKALAKTGVEIEALIGVLTALTTIWDMTKYLEKDSHGQYPYTKITNVRITQKLKNPPAGTATLPPSGGVQA